MSTVSAQSEPADELTIDFLAISRMGEPPDEAEVIRALASAGLGVAEYIPYTPATTAGAKTTGAPARRTRLGTYTLKESAARASVRVLVARYDGPVIAGMSETALNQLAQALDPDDRQILRTGVIGLDVRLSVPDDAPTPALGWGMRLLRVIVEIIQGVAIDPAAQTCYGRAALARLAESIPSSTENVAGEPDLLAHISFHDEALTPDSRWLHTHGLQKFGRPELDLTPTPLTLVSEGMTLLQDLAENLASGATLFPGQETALEGLGTILAVSAPVDADHQASFGRLRLTDTPTADTLNGVRGVGATAAPLRLLTRMALAEAERYASEGETASAYAVIERSLAADADDCAMLALKARLLLAQSFPMEALQLGELMEVRAPGDYRGPLTVGLALTSIGRYREALNALKRAIERAPEAPENFSARAQAYEGLGQAQLAAVDRAHAAYLGA